MGDVCSCGEKQNSQPEITPILRKKRTLSKFTCISPQIITCFQNEKRRVFIFGGMNMKHVYEYTETHHYKHLTDYPKNVTKCE